MKPGPLAGVALLIGLVAPAEAAEALDGAAMSALWALPFAGILLSIALGPLLFHQWWHPHYGKAALFWAALTAAPMLWMIGPRATAEVLFHTLALEYLPLDRKSTRLNSSHVSESRMPSSA